MALATNQEITNAQIAACLSVVNVAGNVRSMLEDTRETDQPAGDHLTSLDATLIQACNRLDSLLTDPKRWGLPDVDGHLHIDSVARQQVISAEHANALKAHEVFAADFSRQLAIARLSHPPERPAQPRKKNVKRKK